MKIQDVVFILFFVFLVFKRNPRWAVYAGVISLLLSIPLFSLWIFFTAERLTWYAAAFFLISIILSFWGKKGKSVKIRE